MKRWNILMVFLLFSLVINGQTANSYTFLLTGASFAEPNNKWFELSCKSLGVNAINKAVGGESIADTANKMAAGTLYSSDEFEKMDVLVIMHVHEKDVFNEDRLKENYEDYTLPFDNTDYASCFDYVIKRYISECYHAKDNPRSRFYGTKSGKPAVIVFCTHWNDSRKIYNTSIRRLSEKWGIPVVEFDKYIGFSSNHKHPVTGDSFSLIFTDDNQVVHDRMQGWHPRHGENSYIQRRMAAIFADTMRKIFLF